jgi:hypothetical protein
MKTAEIELFGKKLKLYERSAFDVYQLYEIARQQTNPSDQIIQMAMMIEDSLKPNLKWYSFRLKRMLTYKGILKRLSPSLMAELIDKINELEGNKKKLREGESLSGETQPGP